MATLLQYMLKLSKIFPKILGYERVLSLFNIFNFLYTLIKEATLLKNISTKPTSFGIYIV